MLSDDERLALLEVARRYRPLRRPPDDPVGRATTIIMVALGIGLVLAVWLLCVVLLTWR